MFCLLSPKAPRKRNAGNDEVQRKRVKGARDDDDDDASDGAESEDERSVRVCVDCFFFVWVFTYLFVYLFIYNKLIN